MWLFGSVACVGIYPVWEGRHSMKHTFSNLCKSASSLERAIRWYTPLLMYTVADISGRGKGRKVMEGRGVVEDYSEADTPRTEHVMMGKKE